MNYLCLIIIAIFCVHHIQAQRCNAISGPDGARSCVKIDGYDDYQWVTCRTDDYLRAKSNERHSCPFHFLYRFCLYQCMLEKHDQTSGRVTDDCRCSPDSKPPTSTPKTSTPKTPQCDAFSGPDGAGLCVKVDGYDDHQWVTCRTDDYLRAKSNERHSCPFHFLHEFCLYQCMLEKHDLSSGRVTSDCRCTPDSTPPTSTPKISTTQTATHNTSLTPKTATPKTATPKTSTPKTAIQKTSTPKTATQKTSTPKTATQKTSTPKTATQKTSTPKTATQKTSTTKTSTPKTEKRQNSASSHKLQTFVWLALLAYTGLMFLF